MCQTLFMQSIYCLVALQQLQSQVNVELKRGRESVMSKREGLSLVAFNRIVYIFSYISVGSNQNKNASPRRNGFKCENPKSRNDANWLQHRSEEKSSFCAIYSEQQQAYILTIECDFCISKRRRISKTLARCNTSLVSPLWYAVVVF